MGRKVDLDNLVNATGIAERAGLAGPQAVVNWVAREADFPEPVLVFGQIKVWLWTDVQRWMKRTGKTVGGKRTPSSP